MTEKLAWIVAILATVGTWAVAFIANPILIPNDPYIAQRLLINKSAGAMFGLLVLTAFTIFIDLVTPGEFFEKVFENPIASAIVVVGILYCVSTILVWS